MGDLEETLERDVARRTAKSERPSTGQTRGNDDDDDDSYGEEDEKDLEPSPLALFDQVYDDDADDGLMDLGIALGKLRMSDRVGGLGEEHRRMNSEPAN